MAREIVKKNVQNEVREAIREFEDGVRLSVHNRWTLVFSRQALRDSVAEELINRKFSIEKSVYSGNWYLVVSWGPPTE